MQSKDRTYQVVAIVGLIIGVCALTIGFAAFSTTLTIRSSAEVNPTSDVLDVVFSTSNNSVATGSVNGVDAGTVTGATGDSATLTGTTITGIKANFTEPGQSVTYTFNTYNNSAFLAYLNSITFKNVTGSDPAATKVCTAKPAGNGVNPATTGVAEACNDISVSVTVGSHTATGSETATDIGSHSLASKVGEQVVVTITYSNAEGAGHTADGDFTVEFGDIELTYSTVSGS